MFVLIVTLLNFSLHAESPKPETIKKLISQGIAYGNAGQMDQAIATFKHVLNIDPGNMDALNDLGVAYFRLNDLNRSLFYHTAAIEAAPNDPRLYFNRGLLLSKYMHQDKKAIRDFTRTIELAPSYVRAYLNRALAYDFLGEYQKAVGDYNTIVKLDPQAISFIISLRAEALFKSGQIEEALNDIEEAKKLGVSLEPDLIANVQKAIQKLKK